MKTEDFCSTGDFKEGKPNGKCWGTGHYNCKNCIYYRADFKKNGQDYIDWMHIRQGGLRLLTFNPNGDGE